MTKEKSFVTLTQSVSNLFFVINIPDKYVGVFSMEVHFKNTLAYLSGASAMKKKSYVTFIHTTSFFVIYVPEK